MRQHIQHLAQWLSTRWSPRALGTRRYAIAAALSGLAALAAAFIVQPPPAQTTEIIVANSDIPAGETIRSTDVKELGIAPRSAPPESFSQPDDVIGSQATANIPEGVAITASMLMGREFLELLPDGLVAVPVRLSDPEISQLLQPGDRIDVWSAHDPFSDFDNRAEEDSQVVAQRALVLTSTSRTDSEGVFGMANDPENGGITLLAVSQGEAEKLAAAHENGGLSIAFVN